ncbi:hypothetical protein ABK040_011884 [Willaertia magna]
MKKHFAPPVHHPFKFNVQPNVNGISIERDKSSLEDENLFYLEEKLLGVLTIGLQKLIEEYEEKKDEELKAYETIKGEIYKKVNPIKWLAMFLMRNNPKYNTDILRHPYYQLVEDHLNKIKPLVEKRNSKELDTEEGQ